MSNSKNSSSSPAPRRILIVGATGAVGRAVVQHLQQAPGAEQRQLLLASRSAELKVDITDGHSIEALFERVGTVDAIVSTAGQLHFGPLAEMTAAQFEIGLRDKLMGQIQLALIGQHHLRAGGSITLSSGIVAEQPIRYGVNATTVNAAIEGFVRAAAAELGQDRRINAVSANLLQASAAGYGPYFPGFEPVSDRHVALAFQRGIEGVQTGQVLRAW